MSSDTWRLKIKQLQYKSFRTFRRIINKGSEMPRSLAHEPIELKNGELGKLKTKS